MHSPLRVVAVGPALVALTLLAACTDDDTSAPESIFQVSSGGDVDVDTPALRAQRVAAGIAACPGAGSAGAGPVAVEGGLPELSLPCLGGGPDVDLAALRGPLVVNLWAQWCLPCAEELPYFARLHEEGVDVLGVDYEDTQPDAAIALLADSGVRYPSVADVDADLEAPLRVPGLPTTVFVKDDGRVAAVLARPFRSYDELVDVVDEHLGVRP